MMTYLKYFPFSVGQRPKNLGAVFFSWDHSFSPALFPRPRLTTETGWPTLRFPVLNEADIHPETSAPLLFSHGSEEQTDRSPGTGGVYAGVTTGTSS
ncbi:MAG: hypothetical protein CSA33_04135 [Desulfobulbus propionicus]|nr:MAG: hypothetical protein CSA33_04135 [Desulfobulbus propionicus]